MKKEKIKLYAAVVAILILYYVWVRITKIAVPCLFHTVTGLYCPGCGITRCILSLAAGDVKMAYHWNPALFWVAPFALADVIWYHYLFFRYGKTKSRFHSICIGVILVILVVFCILRNIRHIFG